MVRTLVDTTSGKSTIPVMNDKDQPCKIDLMGIVQPVFGVSLLGDNQPRGSTQGYRNSKGSLTRTFITTGPEL